MFDNFGFDPNDPRKYGLMQMAMALMGSKGGNLAQNVGQAGLMGMQGYQQQRAMNARDLEEQQQRQLRQYQIDTMRAGVEDDAKYRGAMSAAPNFAAPTAPNMAPTPENAAQLKTKNPYEQAASMVEYLRSKGVNEKHISPYVQQMEKMRPKYKADQQLVMHEGKLHTVNFADDGSYALSPFTPAEKQKDVGLGGKVAMVGEYSGKTGQTFDKTLSPDSLFGGQVTMRGQNMADARARDLNAITREAAASQVLSGDPNQGPMIVNKGTGVARPVTMGGQPVMGENEAKQVKNSGDVLNIISEARKVIPGATGSYLGAAADLGARAIGQAPSGAVATAQLKALEGSLLAKMPRFEGPQSNIDVAFYRQAAGQIGDPTVPNELKMAALDTIESMLNKKKGGASGGWSATERK